MTPEQYGGQVNFDLWEVTLKSESGELAARNWDAGWSSLKTTIDHRDVWLLTDLMKQQYVVREVQPEMSLLEVGCGSAKLSALLAQNGLKITGVDRSPNALRVARNNMATLGVAGTLVQGDAFFLPFGSHTFDVVISTGLLEHFRDPLPIVAEMKRVLKSGGLFFSDIAPLKFSLLRLGFYARRLDQSTSDEYPFRANDIRHWLEVCGFKQVEVFAGGVTPPLGLVRRVSLIRSLSFKLQPFWMTLDNTQIAEWLGFYYLAFARK